MPTAVRRVRSNPEPKAKPVRVDKYELARLKLAKLRAQLTPVDRACFRRLERL